jgi:hypothetical protein
MIFCKKKWNEGERGNLVKDVFKKILYSLLSQFYTDLRYIAFQANCHALIERHG